MPSPRHLMRRVRPLVLAAGLALTATAFPTAQATFTGPSTPLRTGGLVVFGTSLSDTGNAAVLVRQLPQETELRELWPATPPDFTVDAFLVPRVPYARGGQHISNGAVWIEHLARTLHLTPYAAPALRGNGSRASNYAVATALAIPAADNPHLLLQVTTYLQDTGGTASPDSLHAIEMGSNDVRLAIAAGNPAILAAAVESIAQGIGALHAAGARNFLVWYVPDIGLTPAVRLLAQVNPFAPAAASATAASFNLLLEARLQLLELTLPGVQITRFDAFSFLQAATANPAAFGLRVVDRACITPNVPPFTCRNAHEYLFWDGIHPTTAAHARIAAVVAAALGL